MKKNIIIGAVLFLVGLLIGLICRPKQYVDTTIVQRDTTIVRDTLTIAKPVAVTKVRKDTILVYVTDTIRMKDTLFIALPMETKTYKGEEYYAEVSGYRPSLDVIQVYPKTEVITETRREIVRHKNYLSVGTEVGYVSNIHNYIYLEYDRMLHKNIILYGKFCYNLPTGYKGVIVGVKAQIGW